MDSWVTFLNSLYNLKKIGLTLSNVKKIIPTNIEINNKKFVKKENIKTDKDDFYCYENITCIPTNIEKPEKILIPYNKKRKLNKRKQKAITLIPTNIEIIKPKKILISYYKNRKLNEMIKIEEDNITLISTTLQIIKSIDYSPSSPIFKESKKVNDKYFIFT